MRKALVITAALLALALTSAGLAILYHLPLDFRDRSPAQPIPFSHKVHAGDNGMDCGYCHRYASVSPVAGVPDMETCRSCHLFIAAASPAVQTFMEHWNGGRPVPWVRLHRVPDHVYFPHMMHLRADVPCGRCHGEVAEMEETRRVASLKMGWCLDCHRRNRASIDCWACHI